METKSESKYERLRKIGIGSYGVVFKCVNRHTGQIVAIKRYSENDSDPIIRKIAMREVRMLRQLRHPNLINLIEVFRRRHRLHLVFDYCELTVLDVIEKYANNCPLNLVKKIIWQTVNGINYCHTRNCIHRDIKPENILINQSGVVRLCDFGFARNLTAKPLNGSTTLIGGQSNKHFRRSGILQETNKTEIDDDGDNEGNKENKPIVDHPLDDLASERQALTEYVATRWYRAPELLVGEVYYDFKIDIWAIGCVTAELMRGEPIWPGKTDFDQLCIIKNTLGPLTVGQMHSLLTQGAYDQANIERFLNQPSGVSGSESLDRKLPARVGQSGLDFAIACLQMDPAKRPTSDELLKHNYIHSVRMAQFIKEASSKTTARNRHLSAATERYHRTNGESADKGGHIKPTTKSSGQATTEMRSNSQSLLMLTSGRHQQKQQPAPKRLVMAAPSTTPVNSSSYTNSNARISGSHQTQHARESPSPNVSPIRTALATTTATKMTNDAGSKQCETTNARYKQRKQSINGHVNGLTNTTISTSSNVGATDRSTVQQPTAAEISAAAAAGTPAKHKSLLPIAKARNNQANGNVEVLQRYEATGPLMQTTTSPTQVSPKAARSRHKAKAGGGGGGNREKSPIKVMSKKHSQSNANLLRLTVLDGDGTTGANAASSTINSSSSSPNNNNNDSNRLLANNHNQLTYSIATTYSSTSSGSSRDALPAQQTAGKSGGLASLKSPSKQKVGANRRKTNAPIESSASSSSYSDSLGTARSSSISFLPSVFRYNQDNSSSTTNKNHHLANNKQPRFLPYAI